MSEQYGCIGVLVDAKPGAAKFYGRLGFFVLDVDQGHLEHTPQPTAMFIPLSLVRNVVE